MKKFGVMLIGAIITGAGMCLGNAITNSVIETSNNPCKKAKIKRKFKTIKRRFIKRKDRA